MTSLTGMPGRHVYQDKSRFCERIHPMQHVEDSIDALLEEILRGTTEEKSPTPVSPSVSQGRLARFFGSLVASMSLQRGTSQPAYRCQPVQAPADMLAQRYPHLYFHVMCG